MTADAAVLNSFGGDDWGAKIYGSISIASRVSALIHSRTQWMKLVWFLRTLNKKLDEMFAGIRAVMEGRGAEVPPDGLTPEARMAKVLFSLHELHRLLSGIYQASRRAGLTNSSFTAATLQKLHTHDEEVVDLIEWVELTANPIPLEQLFQRAEQEAQTEQPLDLSKVR